MKTPIKWDQACGRRRLAKSQYPDIFQAPLSWPPRSSSVAAFDDIPVLRHGCVRAVDLRGPAGFIAVLRASQPRGCFGRGGPTTTEPEPEPMWHGDRHTRAKIAASPGSGWWDGWASAWTTSTSGRLGAGSATKTASADAEFSVSHSRLISGSVHVHVDMFMTCCNLFWSFRQHIRRFFRSKTPYVAPADGRSWCCRECNCNPITARISAIHNFRWLDARCTSLHRDLQVTSGHPFQRCDAVSVAIYGSLCRDQQP